MTPPCTTTPTNDRLTDRASSSANPVPGTANVEACQCLIVYGANIDAKDSKGNTALMLASWQEREQSAEVVELLLSNGADPNIVNVEGCTALHNAAQTGHTYVVQLLVDRGADCHAINHNG